jgi:hypothetical protein
MDEAKPKYAVHCVLAACEYKAGNGDRGAELVEQATKLAGAPVDLAFQLAAETARAQLPSKLRARFSKSFSEQLAAPATAAGTAALLQTLARLHEAEADYYGYKTHHKKIIRYAENAARLPFSEAELEAICDSLLSLKNKKVLRKFIALGIRKFPESPAFKLAEAEISFGERMAMYRLPNLLEQARRLIDKLPHGERKQNFTEQLQGLEDLLKLEALKRFPLDSILNSMFDEYEEDEDDEYFY